MPVYKFRCPECDRILKRGWSREFEGQKKKSFCAEAGKNVMLVPVQPQHDRESQSQG